MSTPPTQSPDSLSPSPHSERGPGGDGKLPSPGRGRGAGGEGLSGGEGMSGCEGPSGIAGLTRAQTMDLLLQWLHDIVCFVEYTSGLLLRNYQQQVARVIARSVIAHQGNTFVVIFPRQSGKNELQAQIETYLLILLSNLEAEIVKVSPTGRPQTQNAMRRLERVLEKNIFSHGHWKKESGYIYRLGRARIVFLSGSPSAHVVGATASTLLECDEAQDVQIAKWDKDFAPMAASTNATRVFWGTMWTSRTLLARELATALAAEKHDGLQRVFRIDAWDVAREVPAYGQFVTEQIARLGRQHPLVRTQFFSEMIDQEGGMFPDHRLALMTGSHPRHLTPEAGQIYALLVDVAGEDEGAADLCAETVLSQLSNPQRDATTLTIVACDLHSLAQAALKAPTYQVVFRQSWLGIRHATLFSQVQTLASAWNARYLVIDSTGVGAGLASFLEKALPGKVLPFTFNQATKSKLGWDFLSIIETGRFQDYQTPCPDKAQFFEQLRHCQMEILPGPERRMRWGVPDGTRHDQTGELMHDDWILSAALTAVLDQQDWYIPSTPLVVPRPDPLSEIDSAGF